MTLVGQEPSRAEPASTAPTTEAKPEMAMRLRIAWGGSQATKWQGTIRVNGGELTRAIPLGADPETPGMLNWEGPTQLPSGKLTLTSLRPQLYQALDLTILGGPDAQLEIELQGDAGSSPFKKEIPAKELVGSNINLPIDSAGNRLLIQRAPGDFINVDLGRDHLLFSPSEPWLIGVHANWPGDAHEFQRLQIEIVSSTTGQVVWRAQQALKLNSQGEIAPLEQLEIHIPEKEGAYELVLRLVPTRVTSPFSSTQERTRTVQFVVVDTVSSIRPGASDWREVVSVDPSQPRWWERLRPTSGWSRVPGPVGDLLRQGKSQQIPLGNRTCMGLAPKAWQAYPLVVTRLDQPHILEIEFFEDQPQVTSVCILDPDASGAPMPRPATGGFEVSPREVLKGSGVGHYRLLFWPRSKSPVLLLTNQSALKMSHCIRYRVLAGPARLPPLFPQETRIGVRQTLAYFDEPSFHEMFGVPEALDRGSSRMLTDWNTFQLAAGRLAEYLRHTGQAGASISVLSDGSTIYPDAALLSGSRFDTGMYFLDGRDPVQKDIVELVCRVFDREGLAFVPAIKFTGMIPELEKEVRRGDGSAEGIELVHREGVTWREQRGTRRGSGAFYNPLNLRVQRSLVAVVRRLAERYGQHACFTGVRIDLVPECSAIPPDVDWGMDRHTVAEFRAWLVETKGGMVIPPQLKPEEILSEQWIDDWQTWRGGRLRDLYASMAQELRRVRPEAKLYLSPARLTQGTPVRTFLEPELPPRGDVARGFRQVGLDVAQLRAIPGLILLFPHTLSATDDLQERGPALELANDSILSELFRKTGPSQAVIYQRALTQAFPIDSNVSAEKGGSGGNATTPFTVPIDRIGGHMPLAAVNEFASHDSDVLFLGGTRPSLGNVEAQQALSLFMRQLPLAEQLPVDTVKKENDFDAVVRRIVRGDMTFLVVANETDWPHEVHVEFSGAANSIPPSFAKESQIPNLRKTARGWEWRAQLAASDMASIRVPSSTIQVLSAKRIWPATLNKELSETVADLVRCVGGLNDPNPLMVPLNAGFEDSAVDGVAEWETNQVAGVTVRRDESHHYAGKGAARITSSGPIAWIRSRPFPVPHTGRISLKVWIRSEGSAAPPVRLACEGIMDGQPYYRFAQIDSNKLNSAEDEWNPFVLLIDDLPVSGMQDLRVRIDLLGPGTVWIDGIQAFDMSFLPAELTELSEIVAVADLQLRDGDLAACHRTLNSYWLRLMLEHAQPTEIRVAEAEVPKPREEPNSAARLEPVAPRILDRMRRMIPVPVRPRR